MDQTFKSGEGSIGIADDIVIHGKPGNEHEKHMHKMITRCNTIEQKLDHDKYRIKQRKIKFYIVRMEFRETKTKPQP